MNWCQNGQLWHLVRAGSGDGFIRAILPRRRALTWGTPNDEGYSL
jgi:hypothetical protein